VTDPTCRGQPWYNPLRVRESRLSWRLDAQRTSLEGRCGSGALELAPEQPRCESQKIAPVVAWMRAATPSGAAGWLRSPDSSPVLPRPVRNQPSQRQKTDRVPLGGRDCALTSAPVWAVPPSGGAVRPCRPRGVRVKTVQIASVRTGLFREVGCKRCAERQRTAQASLGRHGVRGCAATAPATPLCGMAPFGVVSPQTVAVRWKTCMGPGPTRNQIVMSQCCATRKGGYAIRRGECLQLRWRRTESFEPARSFSCLRSAPRADADCNRSCARQCAHPVWLCAFQSVPKGP